jgi:4-alpha-glucanotransferase
MNVPGTTSGNWRWRLQPGQLTPDIKQRLRAATVAAGRNRVLEPAGAPGA